MLRRERCRFILPREFSAFRPLFLGRTADKTSQNEDIDVALDNCTGVAFAEMVNTYLKSQGQDTGKVAVIEVSGQCQHTI